METVLTGGLKRGHRAAMKGIDERDDLVTPLAVLVERIFARQLDRALVRLRARIGKKHLAVQMRFLHQLFRSPYHRLGREQVGNMHQLVRLCGDRVNDDLVIVAHAVDADARGQVDILPALDIPYRRALASVERDRETAVGVHHIFVFFGLEFLVGHFPRFFLTGTSYRRPLWIIIRSGWSA